MKKLKKVLILMCIAALIASLCACGNSGKNQDLEWPTSGLSTLLPKPNTDKGEIDCDSDSWFSATLTKITEDDYLKYVDSCKEEGFIVDANETGNTYEAYNEEGYRTYLWYNADSEQYEINAYGLMFEPGETFNWPQTGLATLLPEPATNIGRIGSDSSKALSVYVGESSLDDYNNYIDECIAAGFDVDYSRSEKYYSAENEAEVSLSVSYKGFNTFYIDITAYNADLENLDTEEEEKDEYSEFKWPSSEIAKLLPVPKSNIGKIEWEASYGFVIYVAETPKEDYDEYVDEVLNAGFDVDYHKTDAAFYADNEDGYHVYLKYQDADVMFVRIDEPKEGDEEEEAEEIEEVSDSTTTESADASSENSTSNSAGVSDEFKDAMDTYEDFFDSYVEFMKKYNESSDPGSMLSDLSDYMAKYTETMEKLDALEDEMSPAELKYYTEVMGRINKKLAELY